MPPKASHTQGFRLKRKSILQGLNQKRNNTLLGHFTINAHSSKLDWLNLVFPIWEQLKSYSIPLFLADLNAAITVSFVLLPQAIAYSDLAGVQTIKGVASAIFPVLVYSLFGTSSGLSVGPGAICSVLVGDITSKVPLSDAENMASMAGLIVGCFSLILSLFHMGFIQNVISGYLLSGFLLSVSNLIIVSQVRSLTGMTLVSHETIGKSTISLIVDFIESSDKIHYPTFCFSIGCLVFLGILKALKIHTRVAGLKRIPRILLLFCSSLALSYFGDFRRFGIRTLEGFSHVPIAPKIVSPVPLKVLSEFFPNFITITIIGFIQIASRKPSFGGTSTAASSGDRELFALGLSNVIGSCFGTFPTFGSLPRSHIQAKAGGKTNLVGVMSALIVFFLYNYAYQILYYLPQAAIAAIVFDAALNLINVKEISFLVKTKSWPDIGWFLISWGLTFFLKISTGLMLCLLLATLLILRRATTPNLAFLARLDAADSISFIDLSDHPHAILEDDILILAVQGPLEFYNISRMRQEIDILSDIELGLLEEYDDSKKSPQFKGSVRLTIILNFKACRTLDSAALYVLHQLVEDYKTRDIRVILCYFQFDRNPIDQNGLLQLFGADSLAKNIDIAIVMAKSGYDLMHVEL